MALYDAVRFVHVISAIGVLASLTMDWFAVAGLRSTATAELARMWLRTLEVSASVGVGARLTVLGAGTYLAVYRWSWEGWIVVGLVSWLVLVLLGEPLTGSDLREMGAAARDERGR
jgi:hypothetical protein